MRSPIGLWLPVVAYMAAIFFLSSLSQPPPLPDEIPFVDKTVHAVVYGGLAVVLLRALAAGVWNGVTTTRGIWSALGATGYGISDEAHQRFVPGRMSDAVDMIADGTGACIAVALILAWGIIRRHGVRESAPRT
ncbi:MAG: VanZ family protein [Acidobacteria bacterium]|nr:VanZ family protein [Acidobacteriota bacterium]